MMIVMHERTVCRCGWTPTSTDRYTAGHEVEAHREQHLGGTLPAYDTYPPMPPLPPTDTERIEWLERQMDIVNKQGSTTIYLGADRDIAVYLRAPHQERLSFREAIDAAMQAEPSGG